ncbi:reverse transcriptase domain-containing protein [Tanacetum coccineum]
MSSGWLSTAGDRLESRNPLRIPLHITKDSKGSRAQLGGICQATGHKKAVRKKKLSRHSITFQNSPKINYEAGIQKNAPSGCKRGCSWAKSECDGLKCKQTAEKVLPSIRNHCNHRSADKATIVKLRNQWEDAKVEAGEDPRMHPWTKRGIYQNLGPFTDGSSCIDGSGAGLILTNPEGVEFTYAMRFTFEATNNEAEYEALIAGLRIAETEMGIKNLQDM